MTRNSNCPERDLTPCTLQELVNGLTVVEIVEDNREYELKVQAWGYVRVSYPVLRCIGGM